jgi:hypothetical protein
MSENNRRDGTSGLGPFKMGVRKEILKKLLQIQKIFGEELISQEEIQEISKIWISESFLPNYKLAGAGQWLSGNVRK